MDPSEDPLAALPIPVGIDAVDPDATEAEDGEAVETEWAPSRVPHGRTLTLKEEFILSQWSSLIDHAAGHVEEVLNGIEDRLEAAQIPGDCTWSLREVKSSTWISRVRREFLVVRLGQFSDYRIYVGVREYGVHLDACWFLTVEPNFLKRMISEKIADGDWTAISAPKNILVEQDLAAWATVVHRCVVESVGALMESLGQDKGKIRRESKGFLSVW